MAKKKEKEPSFIKVIYFDESSAMDYIYISEGGKTSEQIKTIVDKTIEMSAEAEGKAAFGLQMIAKLSGDFDGSYKYEKDALVVKAVQSTVLTDYLSLSNTDDRINKFSGGSVYPHPDSFTYMKMITPYLKMAKGGIPVEEMNIDYSMMDDALSEGRGYYELIYKKHSEDPIVLRFNIKAFRNNYSLADLPKMDLVYYAIEVGKIQEEQLLGENEFDSIEMINNRKELKGADLLEENRETKVLTVYDVIFAGVLK